MMLTIHNHKRAINFCRKRFAATMKASAINCNSERKPNAKRFFRVTMPRSRNSRRRSSRFRRFGLPFYFNFVNGSICRALSFLFVAQERDEALLLSETEKQQQLSLLEQEKYTLNEKVKQTAEDLQELLAELERLKRDASTRTEQDRAAIASSSQEIRRLKQQLDESL